MKKTIADVLQMEGFRRARLIAGIDGVKRPVKGASLMEVPDILPYVEEGRLLITTLYPIASSGERMEQLIVQLDDKQVAGICIKPHRYIGCIPDYMLEQADQRGFPIIELPEDANLSSLANQILEMFLNEHMEQMRFRNGLHQNLMELMLQGAGVEQLTQRLAQSMKREIRVLDNQQRTICHCDEKGTVKENEAEVRQIPPDEMLVPIIAQKKQFGYIDIIKRMDMRAPDENIRIVAEEAAMLLASVFYREYSVMLEQKNFKDAFVMELLQGKEEAVRQIHTRMQAYGVRLTFPMYLLAVFLFGAREQEQRSFYNRIVETASFEIQSDRHVLHSQTGYLLCYQDCLVWMKYGKSRDEVVQTGRKLLKTVSGWIDSRQKVGIGISDSIEDPSGLKDICQQTCRLVKAGDKIHAGSFLILFDDNRILELVSQFPDYQMLHRFVEQILGAVIRYDKENRGELMATLGILIDHHFQMKEAAEASYLHYNTIRYRVTRLKALGLDLEPGKGLAELVLAYEAYVWIQAIKDNK